MFLLALLTFCVMTVPLAGGKLARLGSIQFRRPGAGVAAVVLQYLIMKAFPEGDPGLHAALHLVSYGLMFYFLAANLSLPGFWLIGLGGGCNAAAIAANDGVMPALPSALQTAGVVQAPGEFANSTAVADSKLWFLGDIFALPASWPMANVFSIGDILLIAGAFVLLHRVTGSRLAPAMLRVADWVDRTGPRMQLLRRHREFRRLWLARAISEIGDWVYPIAVFTAVVEDGEAGAADLALLLLAQVGPGMLVGLLCGPLVDRFSRKWVMFWTDVLRGVAVATLLLIGEPSMLHFYAVAMVLGVGSALNQPAFMAVLPNILPSRSLAAANALVGLSMNFPLVLGTLLGVQVVKQFGVEWGFTAEAVSFFFSAALVYGTALPRQVAGARASLARELRYGMRYMRRHHEVLAVVVVVGIITVGVGIKQPLEPLFAIDDLAAGTSGFGWLQTAWGIGMVAGALFAAGIDRRLGHGPLLTYSVAIAGLLVLGAAGAQGVEVVAVFWLVAGVGNTLATVAYETLLQQRTPDAMRGRVFATLEASMGAGQLGGVAVVAILGSGQSVRSGMALAGGIFLLAALTSWLLLQRRRAPHPFRVQALDLVAASPSMSLLLVEAEGAGSDRPVLLVDDGRRVHRLDPLPGSGASLGYGVPKRLLRRAAFALEVRGLGVLDLPAPR